MRHPWQTWSITAICATLIIAAMIWLTQSVLELEEEHLSAQQRAALEENVRLALWRMESILSPIIAAESVRPYFSYTSFYPAKQAYTQMFTQIDSGKIILPSPLLNKTPNSILVHFQLGEDGLSSPQVPTGSMRDLAESGFTTPENIEAFNKHLAKLTPILSLKQLLKKLPPPTEQYPHKSKDANSSKTKTTPSIISTLSGQRYAVNNSSIQSSFNINEWGRRSSNSPSRQATQRTAASKKNKNMQMVIKEGKTSPLWIGNNLLLARVVHVNNKNYIQGCSLNWPMLQISLQEQIDDLLPRAQILPITPDSPFEPSRSLATIPIKLLTGGLPKVISTGTSALKIALMTAWASVIIVALTIGILLLGALGLSERRGAFVSAVTHELRTPLTTFRMYTEMLDEGMVNNDAQRGEYISVLRTEADRLGHLVENVLAYARIEGGGRENRIETLSVAEIILRTTERLAERANAAEMKLVEDESELQNIMARADVSAVEQILFNLVDNACKYATAATDSRIHIQVTSKKRFILIRILDHGQGVQLSEAEHLFRPFSKSAQQAANSAPGVGLGLSLSRRLAREMAGDLILEDIPDYGACFTLKLPMA